MLKNIFSSIRENKRDWLGISEGKHLEEKLIKKLRKVGFTWQDKQKLEEKEKSKWEELKKKVERNELILNDFPDWTGCFVYSPYGSQKFPDFLVFTKKYIIPIEVKASTKEGIKPMWNSHLPRANGLYIFASFGQDDITFFRGADVIEEKLRNKLIGFFKEARKTEKDFIENLKVNNRSERGWKPYIRIAYDQVKSLLSEKGKIDYFQHPQRKECENRALEWLEDKE